MKNEMLKFGGTIKYFFIFLFLWTFYRVNYKEEEITNTTYNYDSHEEETESYIEGHYYMRKRIWLFLLLAPIIYPFFAIYWLFCSLLIYLSWVVSYQSRSVKLRNENEKANFQTKLMIRYNLF